jgi:hypothetical protein
MTNWMFTVGSWERRFLEGFERSVQEFKPGNVIMYHYQEYDKWSARNRKEAVKLCKRNGISIQEYALSFKDPPTSWHTLYTTIMTLDVKNKAVLVDITTMPRETIWTTFDLLEGQSAKVQYTYYEPKRYNKRWLSKDPGEPRLVYKLSGEPKMNLPTKMLILTGYDVDRVRNLIQFFEPQRTFLGVQTGNQLANQALNVKKTEKAFSGEQAVELFGVDAYSDDHGFEAIKNKLEPHFHDSNTIMSSLGPKLSAVALYRLYKLYPQASLAYAPSNAFNRRYSFGLGQVHSGNL